MKVSKSVHTRHVLNIPRYILRGMSIALWGRVTPNASSAGAFKPNELTFNTMFYDSVRLKSPHVRPSFQMRRLWRLWRHEYDVIRVTWRHRWFH